MNIFLQFKKKSHAEAFSHDLQLQVTKRLIMVSIWAGITLVGTIVSFILAKRISMTALVLAKNLVLLFALCVLCFVRCYIQQVKKYMTWINLLLDICLIFVQVVLYPLIGSKGTNSFDKTSIFVLGWCLCLGCYSIYYAVVNWWLKAIFPVLQVAFFLIFVIGNQKYSWAVAVVAAQCVAMYLIYSYIYERYQRYDFLEKWKIYENYEATRKIFDDIIQGIMIVDENYKIIYSNRTIDLMFNRPKFSSVDKLLSQIHVKTITPRLEILATEPILTSNESGEESVNFSL